MLELAIVALLISLVAGALGYTGLARGAANIAWMIFALFLLIGGILLLLLALGIDLVR